MADALRIADIYVEYIKDRYARDVAVVFYYGSQARGTSRPDSDIDVCIIPATKRGGEAGRAFILDGIGYDFWILPWQRAERIASLEEPLFPILLDAKVLFSRSDTDLSRFLSLRDQLVGYQRSQMRDVVLRKAINRFKDAYICIYNMEKALESRSTLAFRMETYRLITSLMDALSISGMSSFAHDNESDFGTAEKDMYSRIEELIAEDDEHRALHIADCLVETGKQLLVDLYGQTAQEMPLSDAFSGYYEEARSTFVKIENACKNLDTRTAFLNAMRLQWDIHLTIAESRGTARETDIIEYAQVHHLIESPDLPSIDGSVSDLSLFNEVVRTFERDFRKLLLSNGVGIEEYGSVQEFKYHLRPRLRRLPRRSSGGIVG